MAVRGHPPPGRDRAEGEGEMDWRIANRHPVRRCPHDAFVPRQAGSMRRSIGYFCSDGACALELLGLGLLAS